MEKRQRSAQKLRRRLSREADSAARAADPELGSDMLKFSFADAEADMCWLACRGVDDENWK